MKWDLNELIDDNNFEYEVSLLRSANDIEVWWSYIDSQNDLKRKIFVVRRAISNFSSQDSNASQSLWHKLLDLITDQWSQIDVYENKVQVSIINDVFQRYLTLYSDDIKIWHTYLSILNQQANVPFILNEYSNCFRSLNIGDHFTIWPLLLAFADKLAKFNSKIASQIVIRFISYGKYDINHLVTLARYGAIDDIKDLLINYEVDDWKLILEVTNDIQLISEFIDKYPEEYSYGYLKLITSLSDRESKLHYYNKAINSCPKVYDFTQIYESFLNYLESLLEDSEYFLDLYEKLINDRQIMINNIYLNGDNNNLDNWFKRFEIYQTKKDIGLLLKSFVSAITSINPLTCYSSQGHKLSDIWIKYAKTYSNQGDVKTANLIFTKSIKSKFKSINELIDIYIEWSNIFISAQKVDEGLQCLESVLFETPPSNPELSKAVRLWLHYFEILEINSDDILKITSSYYKMIDLKYATPLVIFQFAEFLQSENEWEESFKLFEIGIKEFNDSKIIFEMYNNYLIKLLEYNKKEVITERIRDVFDRAISTLPSDLLNPIIILYSQFEFSNGLILKSIKILQNHIMTCKTDPIDLIMILIDRLSGEDDLRSYYDQWMSLKLINKSFIRLTNEYIKFETGKGQLERARHLFKHLYSNIPEHSFKDWENFELQHGDEASFKQMLRFKNSLNRKKLDPVGFVKSDSQPPVNAQNPDEIDIDM